ncbi:hypothetical protein [Amycolatopsis sp. WQ 127309]|nr:hypothetical protein [Amycolatopsis sp. WQ 127309]UOZ03816.1 hypothetical protein MUY22_33875 [Amycolatopsis sp. WQ 127309]
MALIAAGATSEGGDVSGTLLKVPVPLVDNNSCATAYSTGGNISTHIG